MGWTPEHVPEGWRLTAKQNPKLHGHALELLTHHEPFGIIKTGGEFMTKNLFVAMCYAPAIVCLTIGVWVGSAGNSHAVPWGFSGIMLGIVGDTVRILRRG